MEQLQKELEQHLIANNLDPMHSDDVLEALQDCISALNLGDVAYEQHIANWLDSSVYGTPKADFAYYETLCIIDEYLKVNPA